jgi:hypothetical protein
MENINVLNNYVFNILNFENELKQKFIIKSDSELYSKINNEIPIEGCINKYNYKFHGAGCKLQIGDLIIEYDFMPINNYKIKFSTWKFLQFYKSFIDNKIDIDQSFVKKGLDELVERKILYKLFLENKEYDIYQLSEEFLSTVKICDVL